MTKKKALGDALAQLSADDALAVLRILAYDQALAARIRQVAETYLERNAPHSPEDIERIAEDVQAELENLEVEEVWDRAGPARHGYIETGEAADEMMQRVLDPYLKDIARYQKLGMILEAKYLCMGLMQGLYEFEHESKSEFKDWGTDLPIAYAEIALQRWHDADPPRSTIQSMQNFVEENLFRWESALKRSLLKPE